MTRKIPEDAFEQYVAMGTHRSYRALAEDLGVTKRAVTKCAAREGWAERLAKIDTEARKRSDEKITETLEQMRDRHLVTLKAMHARALSALREYPLTSGMDAMRSAEMAIKLERLVAGEPSERNQLTVEQITREEIAQLVSLEEDDDGGASSSLTD